MSKASHGPTSTRLKAALEALQKLCVPLRGPFITPKQNRIFVVGDCILTETEIVALHEAGKFTAENAASLQCELEQRQRLGHASGPAHAERRRSQRVMLRVAVLVKAETPRGDLLQGEIFTVNRAPRITLYS